MTRPFLLSLFLSTAAVALAAAAPARGDSGRVGIMIDAGVPDGLTGSLVFRPVRWFHLHGGTGTNLISLGVRAGASLYLLPTRVSPTLNAEAGRYFRADGNAAANRLGLAEDADHPLLREVGYDYGNLHLGLDFGRDRVSFYVHGGLSVLRGTLQHFDELLTSGHEGPGTIEVRQDPTVTLITPSARIGILFLF